ncbi:prolyl oligopeptidase family protein [Anatilimnocola sp. NA78]|uniref:prolyl oligopeptidase family serine peptidase n=1 Tax=Anatilimnocola sp. NA78 TaxID=3415683 RepID=UPI003CE53F32
MKFSYPETTRGDQVDDYHGTKIADPYRWLEEPDSDATKAWVTAQNKLTFDYLEKLPQRKAIRDRLEELWNFERFGLPRVRNGKYFYTRNDGLQNQSVLYATEGLRGEPRLLLDPNKLSADGTVALGDWVVSDDGKFIAYSLAAAGSDWNDWRVLNVATGENEVDHLKWVKFSGASWTNDNAGFYYSRYDEPKPGEKYTGANYYQKLYYHKLGSPQSEDKLIYERPDEKEWGFSGDVTEDGKYLIITVWRGTEQKNLVFYKDLTQPDAPVVELITGWDAKYHFVGNVGKKFWFTTDLDAPFKKLIAIDLANPAREQWKDVIPESRDTLQGVGAVGGHLIAEYLRDACSAVKVFDPDGKLVREIEFPGLGSVGGFGGRFDQNETFYTFTSYTVPGAIYRYDIPSGKSELFRQPKVKFDGDAFESKQVFYTSKDGTKVPMILTYKKGLKLDGNNPTILYAYGGFNVSLTPGFSVGTIAWLEQGGVYAVPNLRGGGEYGRAWHEAGMKDRKQNVFDDYIAAAQWLIDQKYTSPGKLAIRGGSNGGLLVGAAMTQRPDLFAAAVPAVGVMDMLRYHKFTIGWAWAPEYGSSEDASLFKVLHAYSPLHNLKPGTKYPATLVTTGDHDDRVVPAHSYKFAAALQAAHQGATPALIRIETRAGHGAGTPTSKLIDASADVLGFLVKELGVK